MRIIKKFEIEGESLGETASRIIEQYGCTSDLLNQLVQIFIVAEAMKSNREGQ